MKIQTNLQMNDFHDLYDKKGKYVRTELSDPKLIPAKIPKNLLFQKEEFLLQL